MSISDRLDETLEKLDLTTAAKQTRDTVISRSMNNLREKMSNMDLQYEIEKPQFEVADATPRYEKLELADVAREIYRENICPRDEKAPEEREKGDRASTMASRANIKALSRSLAGLRSSGNEGKTSQVGPNGVGNVGKLSPTGANGSGNMSNQFDNYYALTTDMTLEEYEQYVQTIFEGEDCECEHEKEEYVAEVHNTQQGQEFFDDNFRDEKGRVLPRKKKKDQKANLKKEDIVHELQQKLVTLGSTSWIEVDILLRETAEEYGLAPRTISREFKAVHGMYPDKWIKENLDVEICGYMPLDEAARLNKVGSVYEVTFMFRGGTNRLKFFWPMPGKPSKEEMQAEVEKFWPKARLIAYYPTIDNEEQTNYMVMAPPVTENFHVMEENDWVEMTEDASDALYTIYEEVGEPISFVLPEDNGYCVFVSDHDTGEEKKVSFDEEGLHAWFNKSSSGGKKGWVQAGGKYDGKPCARQPGQKSTPKCVSSSKRASMSKDERASAHRRKNAADPNQGSKSGAAKPTYVSTDKPKTKKEEVEYVDEACWDTHKQQGMKKKGGKMVPNCVPKNEEVENVDEACWKGYEKKGMKKMFGKMYPNCVKKTKSEDYKPGMKDMAKSLINSSEKHKKQAEVLRKNGLSEGKTPAWQRKEGKNESGGLNQKGVDSYRKANPGSKLKTAVTTKPSKLKPGSKAANRRKSFCSRMKGMKSKLTSAKTARDPDSRINKSLRKWNC